MFSMPESTLVHAYRHLQRTIIHQFWEGIKQNHHQQLRAMHALQSLLQRTRMLISQLRIQQLI
jgi:hypothetical protein